MLHITSLSGWHNAQTHRGDQGGDENNGTWRESVSRLLVADWVSLQLQIESFQAIKREGFTEAEHKAQREVAMHDIML